MAGFNGMMIAGSKSCADDTYAEEEILMPKAAKRGEVPALIGIEIEHPPTVTVDSDTGDYSAWHLSVKSEDDIKAIDDDAVIDAGKTVYTVHTEVGVHHKNLVERITFPAPIVVTSAKLYVGFRQKMGATYSMKYRLIMVPRYVPGIVQQNNLTAQAQF